MSWIMPPTVIDASVLPLVSWTLQPGRTYLNDPEETEVFPLGSDTPSLDIVVPTLVTVPAWRGSFENSRAGVASAFPLCPFASPHPLAFTIPDASIHSPSGTKYGVALTATSVIHGRRR